MSRTINGVTCCQIAPSPTLARRAERYTRGRYRDRPGYWVKLSGRCYAFREHTGDVTVWREEARRV